MQNPAPKSEQPQFNAALNGYRGLCALLVFVFHVGSAGVTDWPANSLTGDATGYLWSSLTYGVEMFFMISGFVILGSLLRHRTVSGFLKDRFIRIYSAWVPALVAVTAVCVIYRMDAFALTTPFESMVLFFGNLLLLPPIFPMRMVHQVSWSLSYEWVFYLTAAVGVIVWRRNPRSSLLVALWAVLAALFICLFPRALFFLTGVLVFKYRDWFASHVKWLRFPLLSLLLFLLAWRATGVMKAHLTTTLFDFIADGRWIAVVVAFMASVHMFASICLDASRQTAFLHSASFQFLGKISYSFYLWHALAMAAVKRIIIPDVVPEYGAAVGVIAFAIVSLAISLPVSWLSWSVFEVRLAKLARRKFASQPSFGRAVRAA